MSNVFGIYEKSYELLIGAIKDIPEIEKAIIFGSRAMGNYKQGSDIDIAIIGTMFNDEMLKRLHGKLNEQLPIPYFIDIVNYNSIQIKELKEHIDKEGRDIFKRD